MRNGDADEDVELDDVLFLSPPFEESISWVFRRNFGISKGSSEKILRSFNFFHLLKHY